VRLKDTVNFVDPTQIKEPTHWNEAVCCHNNATYPLVAKDVFEIQLRSNNFISKYKQKPNTKFENPNPV